MIYIESPTVDPYFNLALEPICFLMRWIAVKCILCYGQNKNAIIVEKHQNTIREINTQFVKEQKCFSS